MKRIIPAAASLGLFLALGLAARAAPPPVPLTTLIEPQGERFGNSLVVTADVLAAGTTSPNGVELGPVSIYDRVPGPGWALKTSIPVPAGRPAGFGTRLAHNGVDLLAVGARTDVRLYQRNLGGPDAWGLLATVAKMPGSTSLQAFAFSGDRLAMVEQDSIGTNRITIHLRNHPLPNSWGTFATLTNPLPPAGVQPFAGSLFLEGDLLIVSGLDAAVAPGVVYHAFRQNQDGPDFWGHVGTVRPSNVAALSFQGEAIACGGRLVCAAMRSGAPNNPAVLSINPPAARGGAWTLEGAVTATGSLLVNQSVAKQIRRCSSDAFALDLVRTHAVVPGGQSQRVSVFRRSGTDLIPEREVEVGPVIVPDATTSSFPLNLAAGDGTFVVRTRHPDAAVAAPAARPCLSVHERNAGGTNRWNRTALFTALAAQPGRFGGSVAITGLFMAIGDPEDPVGAENAGAVHLYERSQVLGNDWSPVATLRMPVPVEDARFGSKVDVSANGLVAVTAPGTDQVFVLRSSGVVETLSRPAGMTATDNFGQAVAITPSGADVLVGASNALAEGSSTVRSGAVVHFRAVNPANPSAYTHLETLRPGIAWDDSFLGSSLDATEEVLVAGAWGAKGPSGNIRGGVMSWTRPLPAAGFSPPTGVLPDDQTRGLFGHDVALGTDQGNLRLLVGTTPPLFGTNTGGAFLFSRNSSGLWVPLTSLLPLAPQSGYGMSVALDDGVAVIGSPFGLNGSSTGGVELFWREGGVAFSARRTVLPEWGTDGEGCGTEVAFDASGLAAGAPLGDRVHAWRFGDYERWAGRMELPGAHQGSSANPDHDEFPNLLEYAGGGNPLARSSFDGNRFGFFSLGDLTAISWDQSGASFGDITVVIQQSANGTDWIPAPFAIPASAPSGIGFYHRNAPPGQPARMIYRFKVNYPFFR